jgi:hypothetical protein
MIRRSGYRFADQIMRQLKKLARDRKIARWGGLSYSKCINNQRE